MKKVNILFLISIIPVTIIFIEISLYVIEQYVEGNTYNVWISNNTNENIRMTINHKKINIEPKILLMDKLFFSSELKYDYKVEINENTIIEKTIIFPSKECTSFSAKGGTFTIVLINKVNENNFEIEFSGDMEARIIEDKLKIKMNKRFTNIFDRDGLN